MYYKNQLDNLGNVPIIKKELWSGNQYYGTISFMESYKKFDFLYSIGYRGSGDYYSNTIIPVDYIDFMQKKNNYVGIFIAVGTDDFAAGRFSNDGYKFTFKGNANIYLTKIIGIKIR